MHSLENHRTGSRKVMVIGFDGATLDLIGPWVEAGILPTFKRMMDRGAYGPLKSTTPPVTPAAWSSLATGTNPGKHGLFDFYARKEGSYESYVVNAKDRHGATIWGLLSQAGCRVTVYNIPATYPPDPVNGIMISGFLTPPHADDAAYPAKVLKELKQAVPNFGFYPPAIFSRGEEVKFVHDVLSWDRMHLQATEFLLNRRPWDFFFTVFTGVDILSHWMWRHMATQGASVSSKDPRVRETLASSIQAVYRQADKVLAKLLDAAGEDAYVMVVSDHGFGPLNYYMHLNTWLLHQGYIKFKRTPQVVLKHLAFRLGFTPLGVLEMLRALHLGSTVQQTASKYRAWLDSAIKRTFLSLEDVDWSRTTAYTAGYGGQIFVNLKGRQPHGIVEPGAEYEALLERMTGNLQALRHTDSGEPYVGKIYRPNRDVYLGPYAHLAADLTFAPRDGANQAFGIHDFASNRWLEPTPDRTGTHRMNGIFFLCGPGIRPNSSIRDAALIDVAPTILALMGVPVPGNMDGQVLSAALSEELSSQLQVDYREASEDTTQMPTGPAMSDEDEATIRRRLEALGYYG